MPAIPTHRGCQFYEVRGREGAPFVLVLPGAFSGSWQYHLVRDHLAVDLRVITVDYRGDGQSRNELWDVAPGQIAEDMCALVAHLGAERCHVIAISLGVFVLAEMMHRGFAAAGRSIIVSAPALRGTLKLPLTPLELDPATQIYDEESGHVTFLDQFLRVRQVREERRLPHGGVLVLVTGGVGFHWTATTVAFKGPRLEGTVV
jgi:pimeloyl-ACP methyl ester carboxylesterase